MGNAPVPGMTRASEIGQPSLPGASGNTAAPQRNYAAELARPFALSELEWRVQSSGDKNGRPWAKVLAYVTNRAIMYRLDTVFGPFGWQNEIRELSDGNFLVGIGVNITGEWVWKWDGAARTKVTENTWIDGQKVKVLDADTNLKGGISAAMKRTAVQFGIGRYLYYLPVGWANIHNGGKYSVKIGQKWEKWDPPEVPAWAIPQDQNQDIPTY